MIKLAVQFYVDEEQKAMLKKISTSRITMSEHIRRSIDAYLATYEKKD